MTKTRSEMKQAHDEQGYDPPSNYTREPAREESVKDRLVRLQASMPDQHPTYPDTVLSRGQFK